MAYGLMFELVVVWQGSGFAVGKLQVRILAWATSHQGLLSLPSLRGREMSTNCSWEGKGGYSSFRFWMKCRVCR